VFKPSEGSAVALELEPAISSVVEKLGAVVARSVAFPVTGCAPLLDRS
jgi:hypothetical protein